MHVLFVHQNFPAQFGHIAAYLVRQKGFRCTFVSEKPAGVVDGVERIQYHVKGGATRQNHYCSRTFENAIWHTHAVYEALQARPDIRPDLIVGHSGFGSTLFLRDLYDCPVINYFEYFYRPTSSDMDFRPDFPAAPLDRLRARARNAMLLLDLESCTLGYTPTRWQRERLPALFHGKIRTIFDGVDTTFWRPRTDVSRQVGGRNLPADVRLVTYVSRGMESMRGFDIFMKMAKRLCDRRRDVLFAVVGQDRVCYGGDEKHTGGKSFKEWVLAQDDYDRSRFLFLGLLPPAELAALLALSDLHVYLTVPFVLSWSLMNALACGATVLASRTAPVCEMIEHGKNGLLADFFDVDRWVESASRVLDAPQDFKALGAAGVAMIRERYSLDVCLPQLLALYEEARQARGD
jgi:glycosyltransferase involved in cell wall biosynthesis